MVLAAMLVGCERQTADELISVGVSQTGKPVIVWYRCDSQMISRVRLVLPNGNPGDENDEILWEITSTGSSADRFTIGETPPGFREVVPLTQVLAKDESVTALVYVDGLVVPMAFSRNELKPGLVLTHYDGLVTEGAWRVTAAPACH